MGIKYVDDKFLAERYDCERRTVWRRAREGHLPKPVKLTPHVTRWRLDEIEAHEARLAAERDTAQTRGARLVARRAELAAQRAEQSIEPTPVKGGGRRAQRSNARSSAA